MWVALVVTSLAVPMAATTVVFSIVDAVLLSDVPYPDGERVVGLWSSFDGTLGARSRLSGPELAGIGERDDVFEAVGGVWSRFATLGGDPGPRHVDVGYISAGLFPALGVRPAQGTGVRPSDDIQGADPVVMLAHHLWVDRFGAAPDVVGQRVQLNGVPTTVVGVLPEGFRVLLPAEAALPDPVDIWIPWGGGYADMDPEWHLFAAVGRLAPGVSLTDADAALASVASALIARGDSPGEAGLTLRAEPIREGFVGPLRPAMTLLLAAALILLSVACANTAGLMMIRTADRAGELAVRKALGASRARLARQLILDHVLLFGVGGALGVLAARVGITAFLALRPSDLRMIREPVMDPVLLASVFGVIGVFALVFGGLPSLAFHTQTGGNIAIGSRSSIRVGSRVRNALVVSEVAMSLVLLVAGGLMLRSASALSRVDRGFEADGVLTFRLSISGPEYAYGEPERISGFYDELIRRLRAIPGVRAAGATEQLPLLASAGGTVAYSWQGPAGPIPWGEEMAYVRPVSTGYLNAIGASLVAGRHFLDTDGIGEAVVAIVDDRLAGRAWPDQEPIGRRVQVDVFVNGVDVRTWAEVVGVVRHIKLTPLAAATAPQIWLHHAQSPRRSMSVALETAQDPKSLIAPARAVVRGLAPDRAIFDARPLEEYIVDSTDTVRFLVAMVGSFSFLALLLAVVGLYGVVSYAVARSRREIGIRLALGAGPRQVGYGVLVRAMRLASLGAAIGVILAIPGARSLRSVIFGVAPADPLTLVVAPALLLGVCGLACLPPLRSALAVQPRETLAEE